jgi:hypothetical protein
MPSTYNAITTQTLSSATSSIVFSSIPAAYTDLRIIFNGITASAGSFALRFNSDTGSDYSRTVFYGTGSVAGTSRESNVTSIQIANTNSSGATLITCDIFSYASSIFKTVLGEGFDDRSGSGVVAKTVGMWRDTSAITTISIIEANGANFSIGTTATLYGIKNA